MLALLFLTVTAFVLGAVAVLAAEAVGVVVLIRRLNRRVEKEEAKAKAEAYAHVDLDPNFYNKQGFLWVLEPEQVPKGWSSDKVPKDQKPKKNLLEVMPVKKHAKIEDHYLILTEPDGIHTEILLKGCAIEAVSASGLPTRKWAKRFPIKVENKKGNIYKGCNTLYIYLETSWKKESWCKALRLASSDDKEKLNWFAKLNVEFHSYLTSLNGKYPSFMKPSPGVTANLVDKSVTVDGSSSKVRQLLKKLTKKASRSGLETKSSSTLTTSHDEKKITRKSNSFQDPPLATGLVKISTTKSPNPSVEGSMLPSSPSSTSSRSEMSLPSERDPDDRIFADEGTLCWNLLISRLFFDANSNKQMKAALKSRIQRMLSNMRTPSYIGEVLCTSVDTGDLPPFIHQMRVLPSDMNEVWAMEIDIEYAGGAVLGIETRLEVRELERQEGDETNLESNSVDEVTPELLEGIEYFGKHLDIPEDAANEKDPKDGRDHKPDDNKCSKMATRLSSQVLKWRSVLHNVAKQVSQVPLSLGIKVASLKGTMRLYVKPPPSDQIWFGFTFMPQIDFNLEPYVGDHKVTSGHLALFFISRFKAGIRETLLLPNCESVCVPWMLAEKDDWTPRNVAPFMWINQDVANTTRKQEVPSSEMRDVPIAAGGTEGSSGGQDDKHDKSEAESCRQPNGESLHVCSSSAPVTRSPSFNDLRTPLLKNDESQEISQKITEERRDSTLRSQSLILADENSQNSEDDDTRPKRIGTRARMLGLGKKMGEKFEEKRRHLEEKGRNIVEKMRAEAKY